MAGYVSPTQVQPQLTPQSSSAYISPVQVYDAAVRIVQVQNTCHARYNLYVQSMKAAKVRKPPDQVQIQVAPVGSVAQVAPVASNQAPPQVGYPALVAPVVAPVIAPLAPMDSVALVAKPKDKFQFKTKFKFK